MDDVIYDWNNIDQNTTTDWRVGLEFYDESLRDGIQSPSAPAPTIEDKEKVLLLQDRCGIQHTDIGLPGAGPRAVADVTHLARFARDQRLNINLTCAARTHPNDINPIIAISNEVGVPIEVMAFLGSSPIRQFAEGWEGDRRVTLARNAVKLAVDAGLPCTFVTEDTVRSTPETLSKLFEVVLGEGAKGLCICDTVGHATPEGARNIITWARNKIVELGHPDTIIDWHGHNDRGLGLINAIAAAQAGAKRIHGTILGVGERVGNTQIDLLLVNMKLLGVKWEGDVSALREYTELGARATSTPLPFNYPVFGTDAFRTGTGVHAAAIIKAIKKGDNALADQVYSGVPAGMFGLHQVIEVGHMGGRSNIEYWLHYRNIEPQESLVTAIFEAAKSGNRILDDSEVMAIVAEHGALPAGDTNHGAASV